MRTGYWNLSYNCVLHFWRPDVLNRCHCRADSYYSHSNTVSIEARAYVVRLNTRDFERWLLCVRIRRAEFDDCDGLLKINEKQMGVVVSSFWKQLRMDDATDGIVENEIKSYENVTIRARLPHGRLLLLRMPPSLFSRSALENSKVLTIPLVCVAYT